MEIISFLYESIQSCRPNGWLPPPSLPPCLLHSTNCLPISHELGHTHVQLNPGFIILVPSLRRLPSTFPIFFTIFSPKKRFLYSLPLPSLNHTQSFVLLSIHDTIVRKHRFASHLGLSSPTTRSRILSSCDYGKVSEPKEPHCEVQSHTSAHSYDQRVLRCFSILC